VRGIFSSMNSFDVMKCCSISLPSPCSIWRNLELALYFYLLLDVYAFFVVIFDAFRRDNRSDIELFKHWFVFPVPAVPDVKAAMFAAWLDDAVNSCIFKRFRELDIVFFKWVL
jgi:hypothetical protein